MKLIKTFLTLFFVLSITSIFSQVFAQTDAKSTQLEEQDLNRRHSIGSSLWMLYNIAPGDEPPHYFQLNYGYHLNPKDVIVVEAIAWSYYEPLAFAVFGSPDEKYPGKIRGYGIGAGYQRFLWKNLSSTIQVTPFLQQFFDEEDKHIQNGFQLYLQYRLGYRFEFFKKRWFFEPSVAFNYWPINTNFPAPFKEIERGESNYNILEPLLHFGFMF